MNTHKGLMQEICDHPLDDLPRLIYADWLQDNGNEDWARLIRVMCELHKLMRIDKVEKRQRLRVPFPPGNAASANLLNFCFICQDWKDNSSHYHCPTCDRVVTTHNIYQENPCFQAECLTIQQQISLLEDEEQTLWRRMPFRKKPTPDHNNTRMDWRRGFPYSVSCSSDDWLLFGPKIVTEYPITKVKLEGVTFHPIEFPEGIYFTPIVPGLRRWPWFVDTNLYIPHLGELDGNITEFRLQFHSIADGEYYLSLMCVNWARREVVCLSCGGSGVAVVDDLRITCPICNGRRIKPMGFLPAERVNKP